MIDADSVSPMPEVNDQDTTDLLDDVEDFMAAYLAMPSKHCTPTLALWVLHTWVLSAWYVTPRLILDSPEPQSGKTRVLELLNLLCHRSKLTLSTTTAALYRRIEAAGNHPPTVLQDEADAIWSRNASPQSEDLRGLYNSGYRRGATVDRCVGDPSNMRVKEFPVFAPVALAGLAGRMPTTITDRAVTMHMRRRSPDETVKEFRERRAAADAIPIVLRLQEWAATALDQLIDATPSMPEGVRDRPAEIWEALLAIADLAGGQWSDRAREACKHFVLDRDDAALSLGAELLSDVRALFIEGNRDRMFSCDIVSALTADEESRWSDLWGKPLNQNRLAKELKRYGVRSKDIRIEQSKAAKGYTRDGQDGLAQAWDRYLTPLSRRDSRDSRDIAGQAET